VIHDVKKYELLLLAAVAMCGLAIWFVHKLRRRRSRLSESRPPGTSAKGDGRQDAR